MKLQIFLKSQKRKWIINKQNRQLKRLFRRHRHLGVAKRIHSFPAISTKNLWELIRKGYEVAIIADMERFIFLDKNIETYLKNYIKKTPIFRVDKKISHL